MKEVEKIHVIYDLDDTLFDFTDGFVHFMQTQILGEEPSKIDYPSTYHLMAPFEDKTDLTAEEALLLYEKSGTMHLMKPSALIDLYHNSDKDPNYENTILTARGWMREPELSVARLLEYHNLPGPDNIKIVGLRDSKAHYVSSLDGKVYCVVDDNPHHLEQYMNHNPKGAVVICADRPWNQESPCHMRLNTSHLLGDIQ